MAEPQSEDADGKGGKGRKGVKDPPHRKLSLSDEALIDNLIDNAGNEISIAPRSTGIPSPEVVYNVCTDCLEAINLGINETNVGKAECAIALLSQLGATSPRFSDLRSEQPFLPTLTVKILRTAASKNKTTIRSLARALRPLTIKVAKKFDVVGNLAKAYLLDNPEAQREELYWASDFHTFSDDPSIPNEVREWLLANYNHRFRKDK